MEMKYLVVILKEIFLILWIISHFLKDSPLLCAMKIFPGRYICRRNEEASSIQWLILVVVVVVFFK